MFLCFRVEDVGELSNHKLIKHIFICMNLYLLVMFSDPADCLLQASHRHLSILDHLSWSSRIFCADLSVQLDMLCL